MVEPCQTMAAAFFRMRCGPRFQQDCWAAQTPAGCRADPVQPAEEPAARRNFIVPRVHAFCVPYKTKPTHSLTCQSHRVESNADCKKFQRSGCGRACCGRAHRGRRARLMSKLPGPGFPNFRTTSGAICTRMSRPPHFVHSALPGEHASLRAGSSASFRSIVLSVIYRCARNARRLSKDFTVSCAEPRFAIQQSEFT